MIDVLIIGGGIAGLSASIFTQKSGLTTYVFDRGESQIHDVKQISNFPGVDPMSGEELRSKMLRQAEGFGVILKRESVIAVKQTPEGFAIMTDSSTYQARFVIVATNRHTVLLEDLGLELVVNEKVPSRKIKQVIDLTPDGETSIPNLFVAGLLSGVSSQAVIAAGQGAQVGVNVASRAKEKPYMWHD